MINISSPCSYDSLIIDDKVFTSVSPIHYTTGNKAKNLSWDSTVATSESGYTFCGDIVWSMSYEKVTRLRRLAEIPFMLDVIDPNNLTITIEANDFDSAGVYEL